MRPEDDAAGEAAATPPGLAARLGAIADWSARLGGWLSALLILLVLGITSLSVFRRYVLSDPLLGADALTGFLVVAIVMLGAAEALRRGDHIRIDILFHHAGQRTRWWLELISFLAVLGFAVLLFRTAWHSVAFSRRFGAYSTGELELPLWIPQLLLPIGAALLALAALAGLLRLLARRR